MILSIYVVGRIIILGGGEVFTSHDSAVYAPRPDSELKHGALVSFIGNAPRPWGLPAFYAMFADDYSRAVGQWLLATIAWGLLAFEIASCLRNTLAKVLAVAAITGLALTTTVANWDFAILTESVSTSLGVTVLALFLHWHRSRRPIWLLAMTLVAVWWTFVRPDVRVFIVLMVVALALLAWRSWKTSRKAAATAALSATVLIGALGWYAAITPAMLEAFKPFDGDAPRSGSLPADQYFFVHRLRTIVLTDPATEATFRRDLAMPACPAVDGFADREAWEVGEFSEAFFSCPELTAWAQSHDYDFWGSFFSAAPGSAASKYLQLASMTLGGDRYATVARVVPAPLERMVFPSQRYGLPIALAGFAVALLIALSVRAQRVHRSLMLTAGFLFTASLISTAATVLMGTGEYRRFGIQETLFTKIAIVILLAVAVDAWIRDRSAERTR